MKYRLLGLLLFLNSAVFGETADSLIVGTLREKGITFSHDNSIELLMSGQQKFDRLFEDIDNARESIHMEYFNFRNDSIANLLYDKLAAKVRQGVEVRLLYDAFGNWSNNQPLKKKHLKDIRSRGIEIYEFDPIRFPWVNHVFSRDHRKIVVIDGCIAYTGGMNVADYYIKGTEVVGEWHDMHCRMTGTEVNTLQQIFLGAWYTITGQLILDSKYYKAQPSGQSMVGIINRVPRISPDIIRTFYIGAINSARKSVRIVTPYFMLTRKFRKAVREALARGVEVEIMLSTRSDVPLTPDVGYYNAHRLMKDGCKVWMYEKGFHHTKIIMVDDEYCTVGSANLDTRSMRWDYEANAVIIDKETTRQLTEMFDLQKQNDSFLLTPETWKQFRTPCQRHIGWWGSLLTPFL